MKIDIKVGDVLPSKRNGEFEVLEYLDSSNIRVKSLTTGYELVSNSSRLSLGSIKDPYYPLVFGVGFFGEGKYISRGFKDTTKTPQYRAWENMMARCYYPKTSRYSAYGGSGVTVCKEWHNYQVFAEWFDLNYIEGQHLDKDILNQGNKEYSPLNCCFVPQAINNLLVTSNKERSLPTGITKTKNGDKYLARFKSETLGTFDNLEDALLVYIRNKCSVILKITDHNFSEGYIDLKVKDALYKYADKLLEENNIEY